MAVDYGGTDISVRAGEDLSAKTYYACTLETDGYVDLADSAGEQCLGIIQPNDASSEGDTLRVRVGGVSKVKVGAAVEEGAQLQADSDGMLITAVNSDFVIGIALEPAAADGDIISALITHYWTLAG